MKAQDNETGLPLSCVDVIYEEVLLDWKWISQQIWALNISFFVLETVWKVIFDQHLNYTIHEKKGGDLNFLLYLLEKKVSTSQAVDSAHMILLKSWAWTRLWPYVSLLFQLSLLCYQSIFISNFSPPLSLVFPCCISHSLHCFLLTGSNFVELLQPLFLSSAARQTSHSLWKELAYGMLLSLGCSAVSFSNPQWLPCFTCVFSISSQTHSQSLLLISSCSL